MSSISSVDETKDATWDHPVTKVEYSGAGDEFVVINNRRYLRHELMQAFGGTLNPGMSPYPVHEFGNAAALGLFLYSVCTLVLGLYYSGAMGIKIPNVVVGLAIFHGGVIQLLVGLWELAKGNTFAGTAFGSYGPFWLSFGAIFVPAFGIQDAYKDVPEQLGNAIGLYLIGWAVFTFMLVLCTLKSTAAFFGLFFFLDVGFILLAAANITGNAHITRAGGIVVILSSACGWYNGFSGVSMKENSYIRLPPFAIPVWGQRS